MPLLCCVLNCKTNYEDHIPYSGLNNITALFKFPKDPIIRNKWIENIGRKNWKPNINSAICIKHFTSDCILETKAKYNYVNGEHLFCKKIVKLKDSACPTIFPTKSNEEQQHIQYKNKNKNKFTLQSNEIIDLIDDSPPSRMVTNNSPISPSQVSKSNVVQSNNLPKILLLNNLQKTQGKMEEESEFIIDEVTANLEEDLITAVYNREPLWQFNNESQSDDENLEDLWKEVADEVGRSVLVVKEIWESLRSRFFQEKNIVDETKHTSWPFYSQLWFLKLNNITAEQMSGISNNEIESSSTSDQVIITTTLTNSINVATNTNSIITNVPAVPATPPTNGILIPATVNLLSTNNLVGKPDIVFTAATGFIPATNNFVNANNLVTLAPLLTTDITGTNVAATNIITKNIVTTNVTATNPTVTNVIATNTNYNLNTNINKSNDIIIVDDDEDAIKEPQAKMRKLQPKILSYSTTDKISESNQSNLLIEQEEDLAFFKRLLTRMKTLSYRDRLKFQIDVLSSLDKFDRK